MKKDELTKYISVNNIGGFKSRESHIKLTFPDIYDEIKIHNEYYFSNQQLHWKTKVFNYINNIFEIPKCKNNNCNNHVNFSLNDNRYYLYCSKQCVNNSEDVQNNRVKTNIIRYGFDNPMKNKTISNKSVISFKMKCDNDKDFLNNLNNKRQKTNLINFGVNHPSKSKIIRDKTKKTNNEKYGKECNLLNEDIIINIKETNINKYGFSNPMKNLEIKNKLNNTCIIKYGAKRYILSNEYLNKNKILNKEKSIKLIANDLNLNICDINLIEDDIVVVKNYCKKHCEFKISKGNLNNRLYQKINNVCTECNPISENSSINEIEILNYINDELSLFAEKFKLKNNEIDIYIPKYKLGIEYNGLYWHSNIFKEKNYHLNKTNLCYDNGIQLLHIFEDEWIIKKDIVKSIIKSKLNIFNNKIFARKCTIKLIDSKTCNEFLNNNHLQGNVNSKIRIGLFYNNILVSVMVFGNKRIALGNRTIIEGEYEMVRFCNRLNTQVIGGAGKLLNYFIKQYNPKSILTFADRRYSNGNLYILLGFEFIENTLPNYYYVNKNNYLKRENRYKYRKDVLMKNGFNSNMTENNIMIDNGYYRIYDCGHLKFKLML